MTAPRYVVEQVGGFSYVVLHGFSVCRCASTKEAELIAAALNAYNQTEQETTK